MAKYFRIPFANTGDRIAIPEDSQADGTVNFTEGYGPNYSLNPVTDPTNANRVERKEFNELEFQVTDTLKEYYETGTPPFITPEMNDGSPFSYSQYATVIFNGRIYESQIDNNTTTPTNTNTWRAIDSAGLDARYLINIPDLDARYLLESNNLSDLTNVITARNNLGLLSAALRNAGTGPSDLLDRNQLDTRYLNQSSNLSDVPNPATARSNLGITQSTSRAGLISNTSSYSGTIPAQAGSQGIIVSCMTGAGYGARDFWTLTLAGGGVSNISRGRTDSAIVSMSRATTFLVVTGLSANQLLTLSWNRSGSGAGGGFNANGFFIGL